MVIMYGIHSTVEQHNFLVNNRGLKYISIKRGELKSWCMQYISTE